MANTFLKPTVIVRTALGLLQRRLVITKLMWTNGLGDFAGPADDTISLRVPARLTARRRAMRGAAGVAAPVGRRIILDNLAETKVDVTLSGVVYSAVPITDEELTLDINNFGAQVLSPQTRAVAEGVEDDVVLEMKGAAYPIVIDVPRGDPYDAFVDARKALNDNDVDPADRYAVVGSDIEAALLKSPLFKRADQSGSTLPREKALIGEISGFPVYQSNALDPSEGYAFHRTAFALALRAPAVPDGATSGASESFEGLALRHLRDYDFAETQDRSLVDTFVGTKAVTDDGVIVRAVKMLMASKAASLAVVPASSSKAAGQTTQLVVTVTREDATTQVVTDSAEYSSSNPAIAQVTSAGLVTFITAGFAVVTVTFEGKTATVSVTTTA